MASDRNGNDFGDLNQWVEADTGMEMEDIYELSLRLTHGEVEIYEDRDEKENRGDELSASGSEDQDPEPVAPPPRKGKGKGKGKTTASQSSSYSGMSSPGPSSGMSSPGPSSAGLSAEVKAVAGTSSSSGIGSESQVPARRRRRAGLSAKERNSRRLESNERERCRMRSLNKEFMNLRRLLPRLDMRNLTKSSTLIFAQNYIMALINVIATLEGGFEIFDLNDPEPANIVMPAWVEEMNNNMVIEGFPQPGSDNNNM